MKPIILTLIALITFGCTKENQFEINTQDIASALHMHKYLVQMPANCADNEQLALKVVFDGTEKIISSCSATPGEITELLLWHDDSETYHHWSDESGSSFGKLGPVNTIA
ncbi:hypothetical protein P4E94_19825 [Pontiellaceae bacterium B12219]|nr:hypothetical protein [Pontiellaceae bacterium B12219]